MPSPSGGLDRLQRFAALAALQPIIAIAQKSEVAIFHPLKKAARLAQFGRVDPRAHRTQILRGAAHGAAHARPIRACHANIAHAALDLRGQGFQRRRIDDPIHLDVLEGLQALLRIFRRAAPLESAQLAGAVAGGGKYRMREEMQCERPLGQGQADGIHQERHVIVDHIDNRMRRHKSMFPQRGVEYAHQRGPAPLRRK